MLKNIQAVIFDLDGTLADSMWMWEKIDRDYLEARGHELPDDLQKHIEGMSFTETAQYFKKRFNLKDSIETIKTEWVEMLKYYYEHKVPLKKGAYDLLVYLKNKNIKVGIATSNDRILAEAALNNNKALGFFDTLCTSCEVQKGKPSPDVYLKAAENLKVDPSDCLAFEDTYAGALAAKRAGMRVIAIADEASLLYKEEICSIADRYIECFKEIEKAE